MTSEPVLQWLLKVESYSFFQTALKVRMGLLAKEHNQNPHCSTKNDAGYSVIISHNSMVRFDQTANNVCTVSLFVSHSDSLIFWF